MSMSLFVTWKEDEGGGEEDESREQGRRRRRAECGPWKEREEGTFVVGALSCDVSGLWIEVLRPADFNPNSLRNREQVPVRAHWEKRESDKGTKGHSITPGDKWS